MKYRKYRSNRPGENWGHYDQVERSLRITYLLLLLAYIAVIFILGAESYATKEAINTWLETHGMLLLPTSQLFLAVPTLLLVFGLWINWFYMPYAQEFWLQVYIVAGVVYALWYFGIGFPVLAVVFLGIPLGLIAGLMVPCWGFGLIIFSFTLMISGL